MYLLDTNFLVDCLFEKPEFLSKFEEFSKQNLYISAISCAELLSGAEDHQIERVNNFLDTLFVIPVSDFLARQAGITKMRLKQNGYKKALTDILIGQTALENSLILVTGNPKDFPQLKEKHLLLAFPG